MEASRPASGLDVVNKATECQGGPTGLVPTPSESLKDCSQAWDQETVCKQEERIWEMRTLVFDASETSRWRAWNSGLWLCWTDPTQSQPADGMRAPAVSKTAWRRPAK